MKMLGMFVVSGPRRGQINENENETGVVDSLRRRANARNVSSRISLRWPIHIMNPVDKTKLSYLQTRQIILENFLYFMGQIVPQNNV